ncbi:hypothetical protein BN946_scf184789.g1, partial [Trametes cinnabarina]
MSLPGRSSPKRLFRSEDPAGRSSRSSSNGLSHHTTRGRSRRQEYKDTAVNGLIQVLTITKEVSSACPQLQLAVGALLLVLEAHKRTSEATEAAQSLKGYVNRLNDVLSRVLSESDPDHYSPSTQERLQIRLRAFASEVESTADKVANLLSHGYLTQLLNAKETADRVKQCFGSLSREIDVLTLDELFSLRATINTGFDALGNSIQQRALRPTIQARFDHESSVHIQCQEGTRQEVLATLCSWFRQDDPRLAELPKPAVEVASERTILWLYGLAGTGKSTLANTITAWSDNDGVLGASFFCAKDGERSDVRGIFRTIAYQLARRSPVFREELRNAMESNPDLHSVAPARQLEKLIVEPLRNAQAYPDFPSSLVIVIDALDECGNDGANGSGSAEDTAVSIIVKSLSRYISDLAPLKFLITSRPEEIITRGFLLESLKKHTHQLPLAEIPEDLTRRDIKCYLQSRLAAIQELFPTVSSDWPSMQQFNKLLELADVLFIFAATAVLFIGDEKTRDPARQLSRLLESGAQNAIPPASNGSSAVDPFRKLDRLYQQD